MKVLFKVKRSGWRLPRPALNRNHCVITSRCQRWSPDVHMTLFTNACGSAGCMLPATETENRLSVSISASGAVGPNSRPLADLPTHHFFSFPALLKRVSGYQRGKMGEQGIRPTLQSPLPHPRLDGYRTLSRASCPQKALPVYVSPRFCAHRCP